MHSMIARGSLAAAVLFGLAQPAAATAFYNATASSTFTITGATVEAECGCGDKDTFGAASATFNGIVSPDGTLPATTSVSVTGAAHGTFPFSLATSYQPSGHFFTIENLGTDQISLAFDLVYDWNIAIGVNHPDREYAEAYVYFAMFGFDAGIASIDIDGDGLGPLIDGIDEAWFIDTGFDTFAGDTGGSDSGHVTGRIFVEAGNTVTFSVVNDVEGFAVAVPEPSGLALLMPGLLAAGLFGGLRLRSKTS